MLSERTLAEAGHSAHEKSFLIEAGNFFYTDPI